MRVYLGLAIVAVAIASTFYGGGEQVPTPAPNPSEVPLRGLFVGPTAGEDAVFLAVLCEEIAAELEHDGMQDEPAMTTGVQFDLLRTRARSLFLRGDSIGDRQPRVAQAVGDYLTKKLGVSGGPVSPEQRAKWVAAYREIARAAEDASR